MKIKRTPKPWASQKIFFDVVHFNGEGFEMHRRAMFLCKCRHLCEWDDDSEAFRCVKCGRKLTTYGAHEILKRYVDQISTLKHQIYKEAMKKGKGKKNAKRAKD